MDDRISFIAPPPLVPMKASADFGSEDYSDYSGPSPAGKDNVDYSGLGEYSGMRADGSFSFEALMGMVIALGTMAAATNDSDQRHQIENAAEAGRNGAEEMRKAAKWRLFAGVGGALAAGAGAVAATYFAAKATPAAKDEIAANLKVKGAMNGEQEANLQAKEFTQQAELARTEAGKFEESNASLKKMSIDGQDAKAELDSNSAMMEKELAKAKELDAKADQAKADAGDKAHERAMATLDSSTAAAKRNLFLEKSRTASTGANAASSLTAIGGSVAGLHDADKAEEDANRNRADAMSGLSGSTKQSMYGQASDMLNNQKALNQAINQNLTNAMRNI